MSDTAWWVATFRAQEGQRSDAAFDDPLAALLAGDRGRQFARVLGRKSMVAWGMVMRTSAIDRLIDGSLSEGIDTVLNLGAGLDTRPYRMKLPAALRWIEIDFPNIVEFKNSTLAQHQPVCQLERVAMDLLDRPLRQQTLARYAATSRKILVITEGLIPYFSVADAATIAGELHAIAPISGWILDFDNAGKRRMPSGWASKLRAAPFRFDAKDWFAFFKQYAWQPATIITSFEESLRIHRPYPLDFPFGLIMRALPKQMSHRILSLSGAVLMQKVPHSPTGTGPRR